MGYIKVPQGLSVLLKISKFDTVVTFYYRVLRGQVHRAFDQGRGLSQLLKGLISHLNLPGIVLLPRKSGDLVLTVYYPQCREKIIMGNSITAEEMSKLVLL